MSVPHVNATVNLPVRYLKEIGRVVTIFSCIEHTLRLISYQMLRLTPAEGRLAVRSGRIGDFCKMIQDLMELHSVKVTHNVTALSSDLRNLESMRNWLSHGVWTKRGGVFHILATTGAWESGPLQGKSRKVATSIHPVRLDQIREIADEGHRLLGFVNDVYGQVVAQQKASQRKLHAAHLERGSNGHPRLSRKTRSRPPESSSR